jgi:hypothetical protein
MVCQQGKKRLFAKKRQKPKIAMEDNNCRRGAETNIFRNNLTIANNLGVGYNAQDYKTISNIIFLGDLKRCYLIFLEPCLLLLSLQF